MPSLRFIIFFCFLCTWIDTSGSQSTSTVVKVCGSFSLDQSIDVLTEHQTYVGVCPDSTIYLSPTTGYHASLSSAEGDTIRHGSLTLRNLRVTGDSLLIRHGTVLGENVVFETRLHLEYGAKAAFTNCVFKGNRGTHGGALQAVADSEVHISKSSFEDNLAVEGGAVWAGDGAKVTLEDCVFQNNKATRTGGAIWTAAEMLVARVQFHDNHATKNAETLFIASGSGFVTLESVSFGENRDSVVTENKQATARLIVHNCDLALDQPPRELRQLNSEQHCFIPAQSPGYQNDAQHCELPFSFVDSQGKSNRFDAPPTLAEATPYGVDKFGFSSADMARLRWCPRKGVKVYDESRKKTRKLWGVVECSSPCHLTRLYQHSNTDAHDGGSCQLPFDFKQAGKLVKRFDYPPTIDEATPFDINKIGLDIAVNASTRWCPEIGVLEYDPKVRSVRKRWGIVSCSEGCSLSGTGAGWVQENTPCQIPFFVRQENGHWAAFLDAPSLSDAVPYGLDLLGLSGNDLGPSYRWCPPLGNRWYNPNALSARHDWGQAFCSGDQPSGETGAPSPAPVQSLAVFLSQRCTASKSVSLEGKIEDIHITSRCQFPFQIRTVDGILKTYNYPPLLGDISPLPEATAALPPGTRWCPSKGNTFLDLSWSASLVDTWGLASCQESCWIQPDNAGWVRNPSPCELPFRFKDAASGEWKIFDYPPTIREATPHGVLLLGINGQSTSLRWCPPFGVIDYDPSSPEIQQAWGLSTCSSPLQEHTTRPTVSPSHAPTTPSRCHIPAGSAGWIREEAQCQLPFHFRLESGQVVTFDYPPLLSEARPYGLSLLGLSRDDSFTRWCPVVENYDPASEVNRKEWGVVRCNSECTIYSGGPGWINRFSECQLPFHYLELDGTWTEYKFPPTLADAKPFGLYLLGLSRDDKETRWCPRMGTAWYDFKNTELQKEWGAVACQGSVVLPTTSPTNQPTISPTNPPPLECTVDGGYAAYGSSCTFPFTYKGTTYDSCASFAESVPYIGGNLAPKPPLQDLFIPVEYGRWCSLDPVYVDSVPSQRKRWGFCNPRACNICTSQSGVPCRKIQDLSSGVTNIHTQLSDFCFLESPVSSRAVCVTEEDKVKDCDMSACNLSLASFPTMSPSLSPTSQPTRRIQPTHSPSARPTASPSQKTKPCTTLGGYVRDGRACKFPFRIGAVWYSSCVALESIQPFIGANNKPRGYEGDFTHWCPTITNYNKNKAKTRKLWGYCSPECVQPHPTHQPTSIPQTFAPSSKPTSEPTQGRTGAPSRAPTLAPTTSAPTLSPVPQPSNFTGPAVTLAEYSSSGLFIGVSLDMAVASSVYQSGWFACSKLVADVEASRLLCKWFASKKGFWIQPSRQVLRQVSVNREALVRQPAVSRDYVQTVLVHVPEGAGISKPVLVAPNLVATCNQSSSVLLDASRTTKAALLTQVHFLLRMPGGGGDPVVLSHCSFSDLQNVPSLSALLCRIPFDHQAVKSTAMPLEGSSKKIEAAVQVWTLFGQSSTSDWKTVTLSSEAPVSYMAVGPTTVDVDLGETALISFAALPADTACESRGRPRVQVDWSVDERLGGIVSLRSLPTPTGIELSTSLAENVQLPAYGRVEAFLSSEEKNIPLTSLGWDIVVQNSTLQAILHGGNRTVRAEQPFFLDARSNHRLETVLQGARISRYEWDCEPAESCEQLAFVARTVDSNSENMVCQRRSGEENAIRCISFSPLVEVSAAKLTATVDLMFNLRLRFGENLPLVTTQNPAVIRAVVSATERILGSKSLRHQRQLARAAPIPTPFIQSWSPMVVSDSVVQVVGRCSSLGTSQTTPVHFHWRVFSLTTGREWNIDAPVDPSSGTDLGFEWVRGDGETYLTVDSDVLVSDDDSQPDDRIAVHLSCGTDDIQSAYVEIPLNHKPFDGTSEVAPQSGFAGETLFSLWTWGWIDSDDEANPPNVHFDFSCLNPTTMMPIEDFVCSGSAPVFPGSLIVNDLRLPYFNPGVDMLVEITAVAQDASGNVGRSEETTKLFLKTRRWDEAMAESRREWLQSWFEEDGTAETLDSIERLEQVSSSFRGLFLSFPEQTPWSLPVVCGSQLALLERVRKLAEDYWAPSGDLTVLRFLAIIDWVLVRSQTCTGVKESFFQALYSLAALWNRAVPDPVKHLNVGPTTRKRLWPASANFKLRISFEQVLRKVLILDEVDQSVLSPLCSKIFSERNDPVSVWNKVFAYQACTQRETQDGDNQASARTFDSEGGGSLRVMDALVQSVLKGSLSSKVVYTTPSALESKDHFKCVRWRLPASQYNVETAHSELRVVLPSILAPSIFKQQLVELNICMFQAPVIKYLEQLSQGFQEYEGSVSRVVSDVFHANLTVVDIASEQYESVETQQEATSVQVGRAFGYTLKLHGEFSLLELEQGRTEILVGGNDSGDKPRSKLVCGVTTPETGMTSSRSCVISKAGMFSDTEIVCVCSERGFVAVWLIAETDSVLPPVDSEASGLFPVLVVLVVITCFGTLFLLIGLFRDRRDSLLRAKGLYLCAVKGKRDKVQSLRAGLRGIARLKAAHVNLRRCPPGGTFDFEGKQSDDSNSSRSQPKQQPAAPPSSSSSSSASKTSVNSLSGSAGKDASAAPSRHAKHHRIASMCGSRMWSLLLLHHFLLGAVTGYHRQYPRPARVLLCVFGMLLSFGLCAAFVLNLSAEMGGSLYFLIFIPPLCVFPIMFVIRQGLEYLPLFRSAFPKAKLDAQRIRDEEENRTNLFKFKVALETAIASQGEYNLRHGNATTSEPSSQPAGERQGSELELGPVQFQGPLCEESSQLQRRVEEARRDLQEAISMIEARREAFRTKFLLCLLDRIHPYIEIRSQHMDMSGNVAQTPTFWLSPANASAEELRVDADLLLKSLREKETRDHGDGADRLRRTREALKSRLYMDKLPLWLVLLWLSIALFLVLLLVADFAGMLVLGSEMKRSEGMVLVWFFLGALLSGWVVVEPLYIMIFFGWSQTHDTKSGFGPDGLEGFPSSPSKLASSRSSQLGLGDGPMSPGRKYVFVPDSSFQRHKSFGKMSSLLYQAPPLYPQENLRGFDFTGFTAEVDERDESMGSRRLQFLFDQDAPGRQDCQDFDDYDEHVDDVEEDDHMMLLRDYREQEGILLPAGPSNGLDMMEEPYDEDFASVASSSPSVASSYAQVPLHLQEEETESFRAVLRRLMAEKDQDYVSEISAQPSPAASTGRRSLHLPEDLVSSSPTTTIQDRRDLDASSQQILGDLELESDF